MIVLGLAPSAPAQDLVVALDGDVPLDHFGQAVAAVGDLNGDGVADFVVGSPRASSVTSMNFGQVRAFSGADRSVMFTILGATPTEELGFAVAAMDDLDMDGFPDVLAGAPFLDTVAVDAGAARVYSGATAEPLLQVVGGFTGRTLGFSVACAGDLDSDGIPELLLGSPGASRARVMSGADGSLLYSLNFTSWDFHGTSVAGGRDLDDDGVPDMLVTATLAPVGGQVGGLRAYSGADASVIHTLTAPTPLGQTGHSCAFLGDLDMDGKSEIALGSWASPSLVIFSGGSGQVLHTFAGSSAPGAVDDIGFSMAECGDQNGDGVSDFAVGAPSWMDSGGQDVGLVRVVSGADGTVLGQIVGSGADDDLGYAVAGIEDFTGDGLPDLLIGAPLDDDSGVNAGRAFLASAAAQEVAAPTIVLGDRVTGFTSVASNANAFSFVGLQSSVLKLKAKPGAADALGTSLSASVMHVPTGTTATWASVVGSLEYALPYDGSYELRVWGGNFSFGSFALKTGRQLPEFAKSKKWKLIAKPAHYIPLSAMPGATATFVIKSEWKKSQYEVVLLDPDGSPVDLSSGVLNSKGVYKAKGISLDKLGKYQLQVSGFQFSKEKLTIKINLDQPKGKSTVVWSG